MCLDLYSPYSGQLRGLSRGDLPSRAADDDFFNEEED